MASVVSLREPQRLPEAEAQQLRGEVALATVRDLRSEGDSDHPRGLAPLMDKEVSQHHFPMGDPRSKYAARESGEWDPHYDNLL